MQIIVAIVGSIAAVWGLIGIALTGNWGSRPAPHYYFILFIGLLFLVVAVASLVIRGRTAVAANQSTRPVATPSEDIAAGNDSGRKLPVA